jgi:pullulanase/glycogen debranching enzyme
MVMDSLRYWVETCHVDGFRFDLATTLGRGGAGFDRGAAFFAAIRQDPVLAGSKLIAEPWDIGPGGYQVGAFPPGWSEWNDHFRRTLRRYWSGEGSLIGDVGGRMTGSADLFDHDGRSPRSSINHVTVHDGFTLADLVSYESKHNEANGEDNRDGSDDNYSTNCGTEGPTDDAGILELRRQLRRNHLASLMLAQGVPLLLAGDEVGNSQNGNNNAYCQDNTVGWVDWSALGREGDDMSDLVGQLTALRQRFPQLRPRAWVDGRRPGRLLRRPLADAAGDRDDRAGLEFPGGTLPVLPARVAGARRAAALYRAQRRPRDDRVHAAHAPRLWALDDAARVHSGAADRGGPRGRRQAASPAALGAGLRGNDMTAGARFGAELHQDGVTFRLWAPAAKRVELMLDRAHPLQALAEGWFETTVAGLRADARYKYRIDGEIEVPDPASHFQPQDVSGPSEVIDHGRFEWRTRVARQPWQDAVILSFTSAHSRKTARFGPRSSGSMTSSMPASRQSS